MIKVHPPYFKIICIMWAKIYIFTCKCATKTRKFNKLAITGVRQHLNAYWTVSVKEVYDEADVFEETLAEWTSKIAPLIEWYEPHNTADGDETRLFFHNATKQNPFPEMRVMYGRETFQRKADRYRVLQHYLLCPHLNKK